MKITEITNLKTFNTNKLFELKNPKLNTSDGKRPGDDKLATFIGRKSKTYDFKKEKLARKMEKEGYNRDEIWWETGTFRNPNGDWRQEIPDNKLKIKDIDIKVGKNYKFKDLIDHKELYKAYPFLKDFDIVVDDNISAQGQWDGNSKKVTIHPDFVDKFVAVHELQHVVQYIEKPGDYKFSNNDGTRVDDIIQKQMPYLNNYEVYASYHKEMSSRTAEKRIDYEDWERKLKVPTSTDTEFMTIQNRPKTGPNFDIELTHPNATNQQQWNPLKTVPNPHYGIDGDDPMQNPINKNIRGNVPYNMKKGDISPGPNAKEPPHAHPHTNNNTNIPKPRPANLGKTQPKPQAQNTNMPKPKPRPANLGKQVQ